MSKVIDGIKLITHNVSGIHNSDDPSLPWRLDVRMNHGGFINVVRTAMNPEGEIICVRGKSRESLEEFIKLNDLETHYRVTRLKLWKPETGEIYRYESSS